MLNKELFTYDPTQREIPNLGVAKIGRPEDEKGWATLRFELEHFVCKGQYEAGLERILSGFLAHMSQPEQPAVWISGFYGSGKSHFLKVLDSIWSDIQFPSGAAARGVTDLSEAVKAQLLELDTAGKREGGLWSAAGTLGAGAAGSPRLAFLDILFGAAGLPQRYDAARFVLWMKKEGIEEKVHAALTAKGREFDHELANMYVSPHLAQALFEASPGLAPSSSDIPKLLDAQYRLKGADKDVSDAELMATMGDVLEYVAERSGHPGKMPLTLIVMDELQQYIGDDAGRTLVVQQIVEAVSSKFGSRVLFVAAGQSAMGATPMLLKLQGRFTGRVEFTDTDVDRVVREVILRKAPDKVAFLQQQLTAMSGEISRHLQGTRLERAPEDEQTMVADYPLLPTRRRFWEHVLRAIDRGGTSSQLRTQLRSVQEATKFVAEMPVGVVVPGDFIYEQQVNGMLHSGVLSKDIHETIEGLKDGSMDGGLKHRVTALVFLVGQLKETNKDLGIRATPAVLADLLIANLNDSSAMLRSEVEQTLAELAEKGIVQAIEGEYSLQGKAGAEWQQDYQQRVNRIKDEAARVAAVRGTKLQEALQRTVGNPPAITQGQERRRGLFVYGLESPDLTTGAIPIWVRDEWTVGLKAAEAEAAARGSGDPVVHLLVPKRDAQAIKDEIVKMEAARETLDFRGMVTTEEGALARAGIEARREAAEAQLDKLISELLADARVLMSGGNELREADLRETVESGLRAASQRMFPKFDVADGNWGLVVQRASQGSGTALEVLGYAGDPKDQKVCSEVMRFVGPAGKKGAEVRERFKSPPYGWPQDAADGALMVLSRANELKVLLNGAAVLPSEATQDKLGKYTFAVEQGRVLTTEEKLQLKRMLTDAEIAVKPNGETEALAAFITQLVTAGQQAGGPAPRPPVPDLGLVREIEALSGNERMAAAFEHKDELRRLWSDWHKIVETIARRVTEWQKLQLLLEKTSNLEVSDEVRQQMDAINANRSVLAEPDPVRPLIATLVDAARAEILQRFAELKAAREQGVAELQDVPEFMRLPRDTWREIVEACGLGPVPEIELGTDDEVLAELARRPLPNWDDLIEGMKGRVEKARRLLAEAVAPDVETIPYTPPARRLTTPADVDAYVNEVKAALMSEIQAGKAVIVQR